MEEALQRILGSGSVPSLAHPIRVAKNNWDKLAEYIDDLEVYQATTARRMSLITGPSPNASISA